MIDEKRKLLDNALLSFIHLYMKNTIEGQSPLEERIKIAKSRTLSDAELIKGGADYVLDEGATELRLEPTRDQIAAIELEMRQKLLNKMTTNDYKRACSAQRNTIFSTLKRSDPSLLRALGIRSIEELDHIRKEQFLRDNLQKKLRDLSEENLDKFLRALSIEQVYVTSHMFMGSVNFTRITWEKVRLWIIPPIQISYPDWGSNHGGGLAEGFSQSIGFTHGLIAEVTQGEEAIYDVVEKVVIKDPTMRNNSFGGPAQYNRWLLRKKTK